MVTLFSTLKFGVQNWTSQTAESNPNHSASAQVDRECWGLRPGGPGQAWGKGGEDGGREGLSLSRSIRNVALHTPQLPGQRSLLLRTTEPLERLYSVQDGRPAVFPLRGREEDSPI